MISPMIQQALDLAIETHWINKKQLRKGKDTPYLVHPLTVAMILARAGARDEVIAAGLLHDTVEDAHPNHPVTVAELRETFGGDVAKLVESVTEPDKELPWLERKAAALEEIATYSDESVLLKSADIVANDLELLSDFDRVGFRVFERFNKDAPTLLEHRLVLIRRLRDRWPDNPLDGDLESIAERLDLIKQDMANGENAAHSSQ